ncbi:MAG: dTMP kinase [Bryobacteraceae bacterium]|nr:dTMP kinase [Bryobacteraceae bacterium]
MSTTTRRGLFLTFEGLDGCGKTTQKRLLAERLRQAGERVVETVEPGGTAIGSQIRRILLDPANDHLDPRAEMLLYFAARAQNVAEILLPALERGEIVISDRWTDSTWAYQGFGRDLGTSLVQDIDEIACRGHKPDLTFLIDIDVETGLQRAHQRNAGASAAETRMDQQSRAFYERVREGYDTLAVAVPERVVRIDGHGSAYEVAARVWAAFEKFRRAHGR